MRLLFIARGGDHTGLGHFARSQRLLETARERGHEAELICLLDTPSSPAAAESRATVDEAEVVKAIDSRPPPKVIVVDMVDVAGDLRRSLEASPALVVALCPVTFGAAWPNLVILRSAPDAFDARIPHLIGPEYAVLGQGVTLVSDSAFAQSLGSPVRRIAVCFGGADPRNETLATVKALRSNLEAHLDVFIGPAYRHDVTHLGLETGGGTTDIRVYFATNDLWSHLSRSSVLVGGGGLLAYEAARSGLPSIHLVGRGIQREMLLPLETVHAIVVVDRDGEEPYQRLCEVVLGLGSKPLREMRRAGLSLPLANGHVRCLEAIEDRI